MYPSLQRALVERVGCMRGLGYSLILKSQLNYAITLLRVCSPQSLAHILHPAVALQLL